MLRRTREHDGRMILIDCDVRLTKLPETHDMSTKTRDDGVGANDCSIMRNATLINIIGFHQKPKEMWTSATVPGIGGVIYWNPDMYVFVNYWFQSLVELGAASIVAAATSARRLGFQSVPPGISLKIPERVQDGHDY